MNYKRLYKIILIFSISINANANDVFKNFNLPEYNNSENVVSSAKLLKKSKILINFWATWCTSCIQEIPELNNLKNKHPDIEMIAINAGDSDKKIAKFLKKYPFHFTQLKDATKEYSKSIGVESLPQTWIIDQNMQIIYQGIRPPKL